MNNAMMTRILNDYADQSKTCWASDSGKAVSECWCAQCAEGRTFYPVAVELNDEINSLRASLDNSRASEGRALGLAESYKAKRDAIVNFIQASINNGDWEPSELDEPFWEELAEIADLNLKRTKEIEIRVTLTYSGTVTVPYDCDAESDLDIEGLSNEITVNYGGEEIEDQWVTFESQEIEEY